MPTQHTVTSYKFHELSEQAKEKARQWMRGCIGMTTDWADNIENDALEVGLKLTAWDIGRAQVCEGEFTEGAEHTAHRILDEHGETCETFRIASEYLRARDEAVDTATRDEQGEFEDPEALENKLDELEAEFLHDLCSEYLTTLDNEYAYRMSDEAVDEDMETNEYDFTQDGERFTL